METTELQSVLWQTIELPVATNSFPALSSPAHQSAFCSLSFKAWLCCLKERGWPSPMHFLAASTLPPPWLLLRHPRRFWQQFGCSESSGRSLVMSSPPLSSPGFWQDLWVCSVFLGGISQPPEGEQYQIPTSPDKRNCCFNVSVNSADKTLRATLHVSSYLTWVFRVFPQHTLSPSLTLVLPRLALWKPVFHGILTLSAGYGPLQLEYPQKRKLRLVQSVHSSAVRAACVRGECPALTTCSHQMYGAVSIAAFPASIVSVDWWADKAGTEQENSLPPIRNDLASFGSQLQVGIPNGAKNIAVFEGLCPVCSGS